MGKIELSDAEDPRFDYEAVDEYYRQKKDMLLCVLITKSKHPWYGYFKYSGLVIQRPESNADQYVRVGTFRTGRLKLLKQFTWTRFILK
jgi:hypothetical protein